MRNCLYELYADLDKISELRSSGGVVTVHSPSLLKHSGITHGFSTRIGGVCLPPFDSLNFSQKRNDSPDNIRRNYRILSESRGLDPDRLVIINHEHGNKVLRVDGKDAGKGLFGNMLPFGDGLITNDPSITLMGCHADCGSVFLYDERHHAIGLAHSGWRGTLLRMGQKLVESMANEFGSEPSELHAALGPSICFDCFEVDAELADRFADEFNSNDIVKPGRPGKAYVDIEAALAMQLFEAGIDQHKLSIMHRCTYEESELFFSYRRDRASSGAMTSYLKLNS